MCVANVTDTIFLYFCKQYLFKINVSAQLGYYRGLFIELLGDRNF